MTLMSPPSSREHPYLPLADLKPTEIFQFVLVSEKGGVSPHAPSIIWSPAG